MNHHTLITTAKTTALLTFIGGTIILLLFYFTNDFDLVILGLVYAAIMAIVNLVILIRLLLLSYQHKIKRHSVFKAMGLILLNIPVFVLYCWFGILLLNTLRISFINSTTATLSDIQINGCEQKHIKELLTGQSKTVWIHIPADCGVWISYIQNGQIKREEVVGYTTNQMGNKMTFKIGANQKPYDQDL